jgi:streptogramin lyase
MITLNRSRGQVGVRRRRRPVVEPMEPRRLLAGFQEFPVAPNSNPFAIAAGPDGNLWFTELLANRVGAINPITHLSATFATPTASSNPNLIAAGPDGDMWFTEPSANSVAAINPATHVITEFPVPTANAGLQGIAAGPDGQLWFAELSANQIGVINPATHKITEFPIPTANAGAFAIAAGPDGDLWFTELGANNIATIDPTTHAIAEFAIPTASAQPTGIAAGPDGGLWFTEFNAAKVGEINPTTHAFSETAIAGSQPFGVAAGPDGEVWFTNGSGLLSIDPATRRISSVFGPTQDAMNRGIAAGPDGNLWFVETSGQNVGVFAPVLVAAVTTQPPASVAANTPFGLTVAINYADSGLPDLAFNGTVTIGLGANTTGGTLGGTTTAAVQNGVATFSGLTINQVGTGYRIVASIDPRTTVLTTPISVTPATNGGGTSTGGAVPPTIVGEEVLLAGKGRHRRVVGYELDFSTAMDPTRAASTSGYTLVQLQRRGRKLGTRPVAFEAAYDATANSVRLTLSGRPRFAKGGQLVVIARPPGGLTDAAGTPLDGGNQGVPGDDGTFVIAPKGTGISR